MVWAFEGTKTSAYGEIYLKILVGHYEFEVLFVVIDIPTVFNMLLGQPWVHLVEAMPSSLQQKVKFILGNKLVSVMGEEDIPILASVMVPFIDSRQVDPAYHSFEFVSINYLLKGNSSNPSIQE